MAESHITKLACNQKEDVGIAEGDEASPRQVHTSDTDSDLISGPHRLRNGEDVVLEEQQPFDGQSETRIVLVEEDAGSNNDDILGFHTVLDSEASDPVVGHDANVNDLNNASYTMRYHVHV